MDNDGWVDDSMDITIDDLTPGSSYKIEFSIGLCEGNKF